MNGVSVRLLNRGSRGDSYKDGVKTSKAICSAVVLIRTPKKNVIVDPGAMGYASKVLKALRKEGLAPSDIDAVINTHMHSDHCYNNFLFPTALLYTPTSVWIPGRKNKVVMYPNPPKLSIPGVRLIDTPGHMEKHVSVVVKTGGRTVVIAGDAVREAIIRTGDVPKKYTNAGDYAKSMKKVFDLADEIIPGHGPVISGDRLKRLKARVEMIPASSLK